MESDLHESHNGGYDVSTDSMAMAWFVRELESDGYLVDVSRTASGAWQVEWRRGY